MGNLSVMKVPDVVARRFVTQPRSLSSFFVLFFFLLCVRLLPRSKHLFEPTEEIMTALSSLSAHFFFFFRVLATVILKDLIAQDEEWQEAFFWFVFLVSFFSSKYYPQCNLIWFAFRPTLCKA